MAGSSSFEKRVDRNVFPQFTPEERFEQFLKLD